VNKLKTGCVHVYTGDGKGKTTASLGLGLRAAASGFRVCMFQFLKSKGGSAESRIKFLKFRIMCLNQVHPMFQRPEVSGTKPGMKLKNSIKKELVNIKRIMKTGRYDLIILDELINCVSDGFLSEKDVLGVMRAKPKAVELVLTGRQAPEAIIAEADYVTKMKKIKHPFDIGLKCRKGIEY